MPKLSIIVWSGTTDKLYPVSILTSAAAASGWEVNLFFTFWGLLSITKQSISQSMEKVSTDYSQYAPIFSDRLKSMNFPPWWEFIKQAKELGGSNVRVYACSQTMELMKLRKEDLADFVDDIVGAATFLEMSSDANVTLFI
ncbi:MAG: DsrE/DsrF/DrsH-like family protein [Vulcanisaeta sp.]|jgi:peroxiredoxin family protein|nr:DsrE/DsrF/DrsH-like family protein [Vulcanisaeta sp.]